MTAFGCVLDFVDEALVRDRDLLWIAAAGPLCNLLFALLCVTPWVGRWRGAALFGAEHLLLALFNLLPVFPLDGAVLCAGLLETTWGSGGQNRWCWRCPADWDWRRWVLLCGGVETQGCGCCCWQAG